MMSDIEKAVITWYENNYNTRPLFAREKPVLTPETSLNMGQYPWARETGDEIMKEFFHRFNVDPYGFNFLKYWPCEKGLLPNFLRPKSHKVPLVSPKPLTIRMLIESAKAGYWLYD